MFTQFYTRPTENQTDDQVIAEVKRLTRLLGGTIDTSQPRWHTFDEFTYFQHFTPEQIKSGIYVDLAHAGRRQDVLRRARPTSNWSSRSLSIRGTSSRSTSLAWSVARSSGTALNSLLFQPGHPVQR